MNEIPPLTSDKKLQEAISNLGSASKNLRDVLAEHLNSTSVEALQISNLRKEINTVALELLHFRMRESKSKSGKSKEF